MLLGSGVITLTFDMTKPERENSNAHQYIRSAFERFGWKRVGGTAFVYRGKDWLNEVIPALMFFRSFIDARQIELTSFTLHSTSYTTRHQVHSELQLKTPKTRQCHADDLQQFAAACRGAIRTPGPKRGRRRG